MAVAVVSTDATINAALTGVPGLPSLCGPSKSCNSSVGSSLSQELINPAEAAAAVAEGLGELPRCR